jgi:hypothetical protein
MTFDMTQCKIGDKLKTRDGYAVYLLKQAENYLYPYSISMDGKKFNYSVDASGKYHTGKLNRLLDIIGFWEDDESFPTIEVRTPHIAKTTTYRVHFNEMFHRDLSEEEAVAIYQQLKTLLGEK